jgi:hypothetical protein
MFYIPVCQATHSQIIADRQYREQNTFGRRHESSFPGTGINAESTVSHFIADCSSQDPHTGKQGNMETLRKSPRECVYILSLCI